MKEVMARLGHATTSAAIRYQKAASDRDRLIADRLDDLVAGMRTATNAGGNDTESAEKPAAAAGFSRVLPLAGRIGQDPETEESPANAGDSLEHPQRDSNPCRHLERVVS